jgi:diguanylate cyclase (GGDEF)-like protein
MRSILRSTPPWRVGVLVVGIAGVVAVALAVADLARTGVVRPAFVAVGLALTVVVNRVYVVIARRGEVLEGIDLAEAPIVALALLLPPGEAVLTFVLGSALVEIPLDRAPVKKVFNVGIRAVCAALLVVPVLIVGYTSSPGVAQYVAVGVGAAIYSVVNAFAVATIISLVGPDRIRDIVGSTRAKRLLLWVVSVTVGMSAAYAALRAPAAIAGMVALLLVIGMTAATAWAAQRDSDRLRHVLDASTRIQSAVGPQEQERILLEVAREILLWKDVVVRATRPQEGERGADLNIRNGRRLWLVAAPRPDSDPWTVEDTRILDALAGAAITAFERASLQAELSRQALLDPLTGVANRRQFDEFTAALDRDADTHVGLLICDLDGFKEINDALGHAAGDRVLQIVAARLAACVRADDLVARIGGDEFVLVVPGLASRPALQSIADQVASRFAAPIQLAHFQLPRIACSLGIAASPEDGTTVRDLLRAADDAMYAAKRALADTPQTVTLPRPARSPEVSLSPDPTASRRPR